ncbi:MAG TPA: DUF4136 domain-containing protein [Sphingomicrobium sp.]|nr:DUF4136 domain-containing protein [Sphingomicrobium sp.]
MRIHKLAAAVALGMSALGPSACATGLPTKVSRFQAMPAPQGQSFYVVPGMGEASGGGLEFQRYAGMVASALAARGYQQASSPQTASMIVQLGYAVDEGETEYADDSYMRGRHGDPFYSPYRYDPFYSPYRYDPFWRSYYGRPYYSRYGYHGARSPFYYGWDDPYWGSPYGGERSYTRYDSELKLDIRRRADNASLFEGRAKARSRTDELGVLVPNLIEAMFTGFPGRSGETVRITVPSQGRPRG